VRISDSDLSFPRVLHFENKSSNIFEFAR